MNSLSFHNKVKNKCIKKSKHWSKDLWHLHNVNLFLHKYANDHCLWTLWTMTRDDCVSFSCLDIWDCLQWSKVISKNLMKFSLIWGLHFTLLNYSNYVVFELILALKNILEVVLQKSFLKWQNPWTVPMKEYSF